MSRPLLLAALGAVVLTACPKDKTDKPSEPAAAAKPRVAVSIFPLHDIAKRVAGDRLDVVLILPPGKSEHGYEPTPKEVARVADSKLVVLSGFSMDEWAEKLVKTASPNVQSLELAPKCSPQPFTQDHVGEAAAAEVAKDEDEGEEPGAMDPHFWLDPVRMQTAVDVLVAEFTKLDAAGADGFKARGEEVKKSLATLHAEIDAQQAKWTKRKLVTFHASMGYFIARYKLELAAVIEPFPGREPTAKYMAEVLEAVKKTGAAALFSEPQLDRAPAKTVADQAKLPLFELDPVGGTPGVESYEKLLRSNAAVLEKALQ
ncbi:MAG: metal ABC transporter substrate-binding protein [Archangium sp.]